MNVITILFDNTIKIKLSINKQIIGSLFAVIEDDICTLLSINICKKYRNNGYGTFLLETLIEYCKDNNVIKIELDDMTDNFNCQNNIYVKIGFEYINVGFPEMELIL